ncbi:cytochrome c oxidase subunit II [Pseudomonas sp. gcc21]|uniref:cytochrome c oxidase subunit II n=1 Tax=Pseudomonas sp. gcc21 TaxID=2726989 RepID=UPI001C49C6FD|nr:cytochrome c oxidase subunit II [Pseudomonas sp. gcc21]
MNGEFAGNGSGIHRDPRGFAEVIAGFRSGAVFKRLAGAGLLGLCMLVSGCGGPFSALNPAGPSATAASWLWWGMFGYFTLVMLVVFALWFYAMRRDPGDVDQQQSQRLQNRWVIWGGLVLPGVSLAVVLAFGLPIGRAMLPLPLEQGEPVRLNVMAQQWRWDVSYPDSDIVLEDRLVVPAGVPVDVHLNSADVIHSFWVPRLAGKLDVIPGRTNVIRIQADQPGTYRGHCAEFCGAGHAHMHFVVEALEPEAFQTWLTQEQADE